jgi:hypothetical protein
MVYPIRDLAVFGSFSAPLLLHSDAWDASTQQLNESSFGSNIRPLSLVPNKCLQMCFTACVCDVFGAAQNLAHWCTVHAISGLVDFSRYRSCLSLACSQSLPSYDFLLLHPWIGLLYDRLESFLRLLDFAWSSSPTSLRIDDIRVRTYTRPLETLGGCDPRCEIVTSVRTPSQDPGTRVRDSDDRTYLPPPPLPQEPSRWA